MTTVFINELHYDNVGVDVNQGVEIAGPAGTDLNGWDIALYNGNAPNAAFVYFTFPLGGVIPNQMNGFGTLFFPSPVDIQNGPDGLALVSPGGVVQFLSYEGIITAIDGPAVGMTSTPMGVMEDGTTPVGFSLQLAGIGSVYEDFVWQNPQPNTYGAINTNQIFLVICIHPDMKVTLRDGTVKSIGDLAVGDLVQTANPEKPAKVMKNHRNSIPNNRLVRIDKDSLGTNTPSDTLILTANHPIRIEGKFLQPRQLCNGKEIKRIKTSVHTHCIFTDTGKPILINGVEVATWRYKKYL
jgi:hypothetical protein